MPYKVVKRSSGCWGVKNTSTGKWRAKCTTKAKAEGQRRLLEGVKHGMKVRGR